MGTTLIVIAMHLANQNVHLYQKEYPTERACQAALRKVTTHTHKTWRFCK